MSTKHEVPYLSNAGIIKVFLSCHATRFSRQQVLPDTVVAPGDICSKYKVCVLSTANLSRYISVAIDTRFS